MLETRSRISTLPYLTHHHTSSYFFHLFTFTFLPPSSFSSSQRIKKEKEKEKEKEKPHSVQYIHPVSSWRFERFHFTMAEYIG